MFLDEDGNCRWNEILEIEMVTETLGGVVYPLLRAVVVDRPGQSPSRTSMALSRKAIDQLDVIFGPKGGGKGR